MITWMVVHLVAVAAVGAALGGAGAWWAFAPLWLCTFAAIRYGRRSATDGSSSPNGRLSTRFTTAIPASDDPRP